MCFDGFHGCRDFQRNKCVVFSISLYWLNPVSASELLRILYESVQFERSSTNVMTHSEL